jgi:glycosyltransferase involved in cell wall biosynthesis
MGLRAADLVITPSAAMLVSLREEYRFFGDAQVIPNGRAGDLFRTRTKQPVIFSAGRVWDEAKDVALLQRIAPRLLWPVHIAGRTNRPEDKCTAPNRPSGQGSAALLGQVSPAELAEHLGAAAIYAAPARYEPFGLGMLEAALCGCTLVLADLPSLRENWDGAAVFVPPGDDDAWTHALNRLARDDRRRADLSHRSRERARHLNPTAMAARYLDAYRALVAQWAAQREEVVLT